MKLVNISVNNVTLTMSVDELETINNALNEVCNALGIDEFQTRMGATLEEARVLLADISGVFSEL